MPRRPNIHPTNIYWIFDTRTGIPIYCGKTVQKIDYRLTAHFCNAPRYPKRPLYAYLLQSQEVRIELVDVVSVGGDWAACETVWVAKLRAINPNCLNVSDGGGGAPGHIKSDASKALMSVKMMGRIVSSETRAKMSASKLGKSIKRGRKLSLEIRLKLSAQRKGRKHRPHSPEGRERIAASNRGQKRSEEAIAAMRAGWIIRKQRQIAKIQPPPY